MAWAARLWLGLMLCRRCCPLASVLALGAPSATARRLRCLRALRAQDDDAVVEHLATPQSKVSAYWLDQLRAVDRPAARQLLPQLVSSNALGFDNGKDAEPDPKSLLGFTLAQKKKHANKIILIRSGEFYETYGVDAVMLVAHAGLNPMGNKCKAGCPARNVQATLDSLTAVGLSVCVYEEIAELDKAKTKRARIKDRALTQIVSPAATTYVYDLCLRPDDIDFPENRPAVGVLRTSSGYLLCQVFLDEQSVTIYERLSEEAIEAMLCSTGAIDPVFLQDASGASHRWLDGHHVEQLSGYTELNFPQQVLQLVGRLLEVDTSKFRVVKHAEGFSQRPRPLYTSTALQIGLLPNDNVPALVPALLAKPHSAFVARFLRKWLLNPPPHDMADAMQTVCRALPLLEQSLPPLQPISIGKIVSLLSASQGNAALFRDLLRNARSLQQLLSAPDFGVLVPPLLRLTSFECGVAADVDALLRGCRSVAQKIEAVVADAADDDAPSADPWQRVPAEFFRRNEDDLRSKVTRRNAATQDIYADLAQAARRLCDAVQHDVPSGVDIVHDMMENSIMIKDKPGSGAGKAAGKQGAGAAVPAVAGVEYVAYVDRKGKSSASKRYTTQSITEALDAYKEAAQVAQMKVQRLLQKLSEELMADIVSIVQCSHFAVILQAAYSHTIAARQKGWTLPTLVSFAASAPRPSLHIEQLTPYWLSRSQAVANTVTLQGLYLLTAPNMSGKSTLMRSLLVAALLANCGLHVPALEGSAVPRFDTFFLRTASYDVPSEAKSAFALEMEDMRVLLRDASAQSLVMIDELGKGTSARDGSAIAGALLEHLDALRVYGVFATHLHELLALPLALRHVAYKRMGVRREGESADAVTWTYRLEDGNCTDSMALATARHYRISDRILRRAEALQRLFDQRCRGAAADDATDAADDADAADDFAAAPTPSGSDDYDLRRRVLPLLRQELRLLHDSVVFVDVDHSVPARLEGSACLYVLHVFSAHQAQQHWLYVGETESLHQRLAQHRQQFGAGHWRLQTLAVSVADKSTARRLETQLLSALKRRGFALWSDADASHVLFSDPRVAA